MPSLDLNRLKSQLSDTDRYKPILDHYVTAKTSTTHMSVRGIYQAFMKRGERMTQATARDFIALLAECGAGKLVKKAGQPDKLIDMPLSTRELGESVMGQIKDVAKYKAKQEARGIEKTAKAVSVDPSQLKVYPMRKASNLSITLNIQGKPVILPLPDDLSPEELAALIKRLKQAEDTHGK